MTGDSIELDVPHEAPLPETGRQWDRDAISRVARVVQIKTVRIRLLHAERNVDLPVPPAWSTKAFITWEPSLARRTEDTFTADLFFAARWRDDWDPAEMPDQPEYETEDPPGIEIGVEFELDYVLSDPHGISDDDLRHFCVFNATTNAWPYWREAAQTVTARMGVEPLVVPVLPVPRLD